jgi:hypothetical protein
VLFAKILEESNLRLRWGSKFRGRKHQFDRDTVRDTQMTNGIPGSILHVL